MRLPCIQEPLKQFLPRAVSPVAPDRVLVQGDHGPEPDTTPGRRATPGCLFTEQLDAVGECRRDARRADARLSRPDPGAGRGCSALCQPDGLAR